MYKMSKVTLRLVLDLDETLIYCTQSTDMNRYQDFDKFKLGDGTVILLRPHYYAFIGYVVNRFDEIYVYTAATEKYAKDVIDVIFNGVNIHTIWTSVDCIYTADNVYKSLQGKFNKHGEHIDSPNTFIIDDRSDISDLNIYACGTNHLVINGFNGNSGDNELLSIIKKIDSLTRALKA